MPVKKYQIKSKEIAFLSANTWDVSGGGNYGYNSIGLIEMKLFLIALIIIQLMRLAIYRNYLI